MKLWILAATTLLLAQGADAREHWGPPSACPKPKENCCPKPCKPACPPKACAPKKCAPAPCPTKKCAPAKCQPKCCPKPDPCCPPVCFERSLPTSPCCTPTAYSEPANVELRCAADVFITANFIYWEAMQGGMDLAMPGSGTIAGGVLTSTSITLPATGRSVLTQDFEYKPGFQVGLGWSGGKDNWTMYAEYTWLHGSTHTSKTAPAPGVAAIDGAALPQSGIWLPTNWLMPDVYANDATTHISSKWKFKIDLVDAQLSRPFYSGARFTLEPFFGLRGAWIRQNLEIDATNLATTGIGIPSATREAHYSSRSSAVGPRVGINGNWHLGYGMRFIGNTAASLLFTSYDVLQNVATPDGSGGYQFPVKTKLNDYNALRPNLDLSLGLGWGSYMYCRRFYIDLAATYDFSVFWDQNMMRYLADEVEVGVGSAAGNLFLQGLTIQTRFDF